MVQWDDQQILPQKENNKKKNLFKNHHFGPLEIDKVLKFEYGRWELVAFWPGDDLIPKLQTIEVLLGQDCP